jgi:hypothetical protein
MPARLEETSMQLGSVRLLLSLLVLFVFGTVACDDDPAGGQDAAVDGPAFCRMADCQSLPRPAVKCDNGGTPEFSCTRTLSGRCGWDAEHPICRPPDSGASGPEAGADAASADGASADGAAAEVSEG